MLNDPPPEKRPRRQHPLEQRPAPSGEQREGGSQRVMLHIPVARPRLTYALIALNGAIFVIAFYLMSDLQRLDFYNWGASNPFYVLEQGEFHRLFTAMFLHGDITHIIFNMLSLYYIGATVERFFGTVRFAIIYLLGGLGGSVLSVLLNGDDVFSVGASGAVFALVGAELIFLYQHRKLLGQMARQQFRNLLFIAGMNLLIGFVGNAAAAGVRIDNWGHLGGLAGGLALAWFISPMFIPMRHPERPDALTIEDINPLEKHTQMLLLYVSALIALLIVGTFLAG